MLEQAVNLPEETRSKLLGHVEAIESDAARALDQASETDAEPEQPHHGIGRLVGAVEEIEASHPDITALINRIAGTLTNIGI
jgi:hypothetical protein